MSSQFPNMTPITRVAPGDRIAPGVPLPSNYQDLSDEDQRRARVNGCRQWLLPDATAEDWWISFVLFDALYLRDNESLFYDVDPYPWGRHQREMVEAVAENRQTLVVWPRGFAKTTTLLILLLMVVVTEAISKNAYMTSKQGKAREFLVKVMTQLETNTRLIEDFAPEYWRPGRPRKMSLKPGRDATATWSAHYGSFIATNGSSITVGSVEAATRGLRANRIMALDDPEKDFKPGTDATKAREFLDNFLFTVLKKINIGRNWRLLWSGTRISRKHFIWHASKDDDERFTKFWKRLTYAAAYPSIDDMKVALWPERMSIAEIQQEIEEDGRLAVLSERFNEPGSGGGESFYVSEPLHGYELLFRGKQIDPLRLWNGPYSRPRSIPSEHELRIRYLSDKDRMPVDISLVDLLHRSRVTQALDWAPTISAQSDFTVITVCTFGLRGELIVLDTMAGRWLPSVRNRHFIETGLKWRPDRAGVESPSLDHEIMYDLISSADEAEVRSSYRLPIQQIPQHGRSKVDKIQSLAWRFGDEERPRGMIKLPWWQTGSSWKMLFHQIDEANFGMADLGLSHDDSIETVAMCDDLGGRSPRSGRQPAPRRLSVRERVLSGHRGPDDCPLIQGIDPMTLTPAEMDAIIRQREKHDEQQRAAHPGAASVF